MEIKKYLFPTNKPAEELLFDFPQTETLQVGYVTILPGQSNHLGCHADEEEVYLILDGRADLRLGDEVSSVGKGDTLYVPRNVVHQMTCTSQEPLEYLYIANYPDMEGRK